MHLTNQAAMLLFAAFGLHHIGNVNVKFLVANIFDGIDDDIRGVSVYVMIGHVKRKGIQLELQQTKNSGMAGTVPVT